MIESLVKHLKQEYDLVENDPGFGIIKCWRKNKNVIYISYSKTGKFNLIDVKSGNCVKELKKLAKILEEVNKECKA